MCVVKCSGEQTTSYLAMYNTARLMDITSPGKVVCRSVYCRIP